MISSIKDFEKFINTSEFNNIFILCGEKSFYSSGACNLIKKFAEKKNLKYILNNLLSQL